MVALYLLAFRRLFVCEHLHSLHADIISFCIYNTLWWGDLNFGFTQSMKKHCLFIAVKVSPVGCMLCPPSYISEERIELGMVYLIASFPLCLFSRPRNPTLVVSHWRVSPKAFIPFVSLSTFPSSLGYTSSLKLETNNSSSAEDTGSPEI